MFHSSTDRHNGLVKPPEDDDVDDRENHMFECKICSEVYLSETEVEVHKQTSHKVILSLSTPPKSLETLCLVSIL